MPMAIQGADRPATRAPSATDERSDAPARRMARRLLHVQGTPDTPIVRAVTEDEVRRRAYEIFAARAGAPGSPEEDWRMAETELRAR